MLYTSSSLHFFLHFFSFLFFESLGALHFFSTLLLYTSSYTSSYSSEPFSLRALVLYTSSYSCKPFSLRALVLYTSSYSCKPFSLRALVLYTSSYSCEPVSLRAFVLYTLVTCLLACHLDLFPLSIFFLHLFLFSYLCFGEIL